MSDTHLGAYLVTAFLFALRNLSINNETVSP
jgi:hypothetical protein